jgi:hypothetical protein
MRVDPYHCARWDIFRGEYFDGRRAERQVLPSKERDVDELGRQVGIVCDFGSVGRRES